MHGFALADRLEWRSGGVFAWEGVGWIGGDFNRLWLRTEGERIAGGVEDAHVELLAGRSVNAWWDVVAGVRHDFGDAPSTTWAAIGVQGLSPYKSEVQATAYVASGGRSAWVASLEYDTLLTNRLILQWHGEATAFGHADRARDRDAGLSSLEAGLRLRYELTRRFAPYVGLQVERHYGGHSGSDTDTAVLAGVRSWF